MDITTPLLVIGGTGAVCGGILAAAARFFAVHEDPRIEKTTECLPGMNCGGCGYAGCADYARAIIVDKAPINLCTPGGSDTLAALCAFLGVVAEAAERKVAVVLCNGGDKVATRRGQYNGVADCAAADLIGGFKGCRYGCLGLGSCARACPVDAIEITADNLAVVHPERCIACGKCVGACPRKLIKLVPESRYIHVLCSSKDRGPAVKKVCSVGCIGCTLCARTVANTGIKMEGALAVVDYQTPLDNEAVIAKCPQKTIVKRYGLKTPPAEMAPAEAPAATPPAPATPVA